MRLPEPRTDHRNLRASIVGAGDALAIEEGTPADGADTEHAEQIRRDLRYLDALGESFAFTSGGQRGAPESGGSDAFERTRALADVTHFGARQASVRNGSICADLPNADEASRIGIRRF